MDDMTAPLTWSQNDYIAPLVVGYNIVEILRYQSGHGQEQRKVKAL